MSVYPVAQAPVAELRRPSTPVYSVITPRRSLRTDTVIVSDIHLGSAVCRARALREALAAWYPFRRLIILGDLFEDLNLARLGKADFELLDDLRDLSGREDVELDWIEGNHDEQGHDLVHRLIGARTHDQMMLDLYGKRYLFMHGHQFDDFLRDHPTVSTVASNIYCAVQVREGRSRRFSRWLKQKSKQWLKVCQKVERMAADHARQFDANFVLCGHTHYHDAALSRPSHSVRYINTGCWTDMPSTLTTIDHKGLRQFVYS